MKKNNLSIRDYFSIAVLNGIMANMASTITEEEIKNLPRTCYRIADLMMKERDA